MTEAKPFLTLDTDTGIHIEIPSKGKESKTLWVLTKKLVDKFFEEEKSQNAES